MVDANVVFGILLVLIGLALFVGEILHPGVFLLIPGTVILVSGAMYILLPDFLVANIAGPAVVVVAALIATVVSIQYYRYLAPVHPPMVSMPATLAGQEGVVVAAVVPDTLKGKVRIKSEIWSARSSVAIPAGARVRVLGGEGVAVDVTPVSEPAS